MITSWGLSGDRFSHFFTEFTSVCPQFDILWENLSIFDHIKLVCGIKGFKPQNLNEFAMELLEKIGLDGCLHKKISELSGGMRRRVSIVLATIGDPKLIIFDEPTSGLDPENRNTIWKLIISIKRPGRSILLTTHILEEADMLSDRICIMSAGEVRVTGTSSELKRAHGSGYKITAYRASNSTQESILEYCQHISTCIPSSKQLTSTGLNVVHRVPTDKILELMTFHKSMTDTLKEKLHVERISMSSSTLDDVFLNVLGK